MLFVGDSFTWGEGLELYMDKEPFITMRTQFASDSELRAISNYEDAEVEDWRKMFRFAAYVDGFESYVQRRNGGSFHSLGRDAYREVGKNQFNKNDIIIIQIPPAERSFFQSNYNLNPSGTTNQYYPYFNDVFENPLRTLLEKYYIDGDAKHIKSLSWMMGYDTPIDMIDNQEKVLDKLSYRNTKLFFYSYVWDLMQRFDVYFIGPWGKENYESFSNCDEFKEKTIPLEYNGNQYDSIYTLHMAMKNDGEPFTIFEQWKKTNNLHPTLKGHKIIGESVNKYFKNNNPKTNI